MSILSRTNLSFILIRLSGNETLQSISFACREMDPFLHLFLSLSSFFLFVEIDEEKPLVEFNLVLLSNALVRKKK